MISIEEIINSRNKVRHQQKYADAFSDYFKLHFNREPEFCCSFKDFDLLRNLIKPPKNKDMKNTKYRVLYAKDKYLFYKNGNRVHRSFAGKASEKFLDEFLEKQTEFPDAEKNIILIRKQVKKSKTVKLENLKEDKSKDDNSKDVNLDETGLVDNLNHEKEATENLDVDNSTDYASMLEGKKSLDFSVKESVEIIHNLSEEELKFFDGEERPGIIKAIAARLKNLKEGK